MGLELARRQKELELQEQEWGDKLRTRHCKEHGYAHFYRIVEILEGEPPDAVLINFADDWGFNFGGKVIRYTQGEKRFARVKVYID